VLPSADDGEDRRLEGDQVKVRVTLDGGDEFDPTVLNPVEWLLYGATCCLARLGDEDWLALSEEVRECCLITKSWCHRRVFPFPDVQPLIDALTK